MFRQRRSQRLPTIEQAAAGCQKGGPAAGPRVPVHNTGKNGCLFIEVGVSPRAPTDYNGGDNRSLSNRRGSMATLFVENLTVVDFSYLHAKRGMVGESWIVDLELSGDLDAQGMVFDFGHIKKALKQVVDERVDHRLLLPGESDLLGLHRREDGHISLEWRYLAGEIRMVAPADSILELSGTAITKAGVTLYLMDLIRDSVPDNVTEVRVVLREQDTGTAPFYHYSHGLKKHDGNCQRIAHGHRSGIEIFENGRRSRYWEKLWADRWEDIYIGTRSDLEGTYYVEDVPHHRFRYDAEQGHFELVIPEDHCYLVDTDSTVENLAEHIAEELAREAPGKRFRVRAFEGVGKGAIAEAGEDNPGRAKAGWLQGSSVL